MAQGTQTFKLTYTGQQVQELLDKIESAGILTPGEREMLEKMADGAVATPTEMGLMSAEDKAKLDELEDSDPISDTDITDICQVPTN